jgi:hypothetical protein
VKEIEVEVRVVFVVREVPWVHDSFGFCMAWKVCCYCFVRRALYYLSHAPSLLLLLFKILIQILYLSLRLDFLGNTIFNIIKKCILSDLIFTLGWTLFYKSICKEHHPLFSLRILKKNIETFYSGWFLTLISSQCWELKDNPRSGKAILKWEVNSVVQGYCIFHGTTGFQVTGVNRLYASHI